MLGVRQQVEDEHLHSGSSSWTPESSADFIGVDPDPHRIERPSIPDVIPKRSEGSRAALLRSVRSLVARKLTSLGMTVLACRSALMEPAVDARHLTTNS